MGAKATEPPGCAMSVTGIADTRVGAVQLSFAQGANTSSKSINVAPSKTQGRGIDICITLKSKLNSLEVDHNFLIQGVVFGPPIETQNIFLPARESTTSFRIICGSGRSLFKSIFRMSVPLICFVLLELLFMCGQVCSVTMSPHRLQ